MQLTRFFTCFSKALLQSGRFVLTAFLMQCLITTPFVVLPASAQTEQPPAEQEVTPENAGEQGEPPAIQEEQLDQEENLPQGMGSVVGQVIDQDTGEYVGGVRVAVEWPSQQFADFGQNQPQEKLDLTDQDGRYRINDIPAGFYSLVFTKDGYQPIKITDVEVTAGGTTRNDIPFKPASAESAGEVFQLDDFTVSSEALGESGVALEALRKQSAASVDFLTSADFSKYAATDIGDVVNRIPGVVVQDGQFPIVRGLSDRYSSTLINGIPVPSPDPFRQSVQLDLFPTSIMENVVANKTFLPYMPSNSSGANFELATKAFPDEFTVSFKGGVRFNDNAQDVFLRDPSFGTRDLLGYGKSTRPGLPDTDNRASVASSLTNQFGVRFGGSPVGTTLGFSVGDTHEIWNRQVGVVLAASYDSKYTTRIGFQQDRFGTRSGTNPDWRSIPGARPPGIPPGFIPDGTRGGEAFELAFQPGSMYFGRLDATDLNYQTIQSVGTVLVGALAGVSAHLDPEGNNQLSFVTLYSNVATDTVQQRGFGYVPGGGLEWIDSSSGLDVIGGGGTGFVFNEVTQYEERNLTSFQLLGDHNIVQLDDLKINWALSHSKTSADIPHQTDFSYLYDTNPGDQGFYTEVSTDFVPFLTQTWRSIDENLDFARIDLEYDWKFFNDLIGKARAGFFYENASRSVEATLISYNTQVSNSSRFGSVDELINANTNAFNQAGDAGAGTGVGFVSPSTADTTRKIRAAYAMMEFPVTSEVKAIGGARFEQINMFAEGSSGLGFTNNVAFWNQTPPFSGPNSPTNGEILGITNPGAPGVIDTTRTLPAATIIYEPEWAEGLTIRGAFSKTVARPSFRELGPYFELDITTGDLILGNPNLQLSDVQSWDIRVEYNFTDHPGDIIAASVFYKDVNQPIEKVILYDKVARQSVQSWFNNPDRAVIKGVELEVAKNLGVFAPELEDFSISANFSLIDASVGYPESIANSYIAENSVRLGGQTVTFPAGIYVGNDGAPFGNSNFPPGDRRLFDQPEWIVNTALTWSNPDLGSTINISLFAQSDVLTGVGSGFDVSGSIDQYTDQFYQLDLSYQQLITENLVLKFAMKNITDTPRSIIYDPSQTAGRIERLSYRIGREYRLALEYTF
ncbi:MAG: TonB-dependent receptor [Verrucomicrobiota bacterium]